MSWQKTLKEYFEALVVALVLALFIRTFVVQAFKIPSGSMLDTLLVGDHLLVTKFSYGVDVPFTDYTIIPVGEPQHGDIIVFEYPGDRDKDYIKRVVGVPGDTLEMVDKKFFRNGELVSEPYVQHTDARSGGQRDNFGPIQVPEGKYFVMGDNRDESSDSRFWGFVDEDLILGKAWIIYFSMEGYSDIRFGRIGQTIH